ncbi:MAG: GGDEF domain-containing protein [Lachnospiraceae bacterium]|nr:GGDEF domain-containing protein [Lachnospiraceae bacterium]
MDKKKGITLSVTIMLTVAVFIILYACNLSSSESVRIRQYSTHSFKDDWTFNSVVLDFDDSLYASDNPLQHAIDQQLLTKVLPYSIDETNGILFRTSHQSVRVYVENELIYEYGYRTNSLFPIPGSAWHIIPLSSDYSEKELKIELTSYMHKYDTIDSVFYGDLRSLSLHILKKNAFGIIASIFLLALSCFLFFMWIAIRKLPSSTSLFHLSTLSFFVFLWSISETQILQYFYNNITAINLYTYETLLLLPLPLSLYFMESQNHHVKNVARKLLYYLFFNFILVHFLHFSKILYFEESLFLIHVYFIISIITLIMANFKGVRLKYFFSRNASNTWAFIILIITMVIDLSRYYLQYFNDSALFIRIGLFIYIAILGVNTLHSSVDMMILGQKAQVYENMAYHDILTSTWNRTAFEEKLNRIEGDANLKFHTSILSVDLNDLKEINDQYGHAVGDQYIIRCANFLSACFYGLGDCYRIGGDEFVVILNNQSKSLLDEKLKELTQPVKFIFEGNQKHVNFAYGIASFDTSRDLHITDTLKRADSYMYKTKKDMKADYQEFA